MPRAARPQPHTRRSSRAFRGAIATNNDRVHPDATPRHATVRPAGARRAHTLVRGRRSYYTIRLIPLKITAAKFRTPVIIQSNSYCHLSGRWGFRGLGANRARGARVADRTAGLLAVLLGPPRRTLRAVDGHRNENEGEGEIGTAPTIKWKELENGVGWGFLISLVGGNVPAWLYAAEL